MLNAICQEAENITADDAYKDILYYQFAAARYGKDFMKFNIEWYQKLLNEVRGRNPCNQESYLIHR